MIYRCPRCHRIVAKEDARFTRQGTLRPLNGSAVIVQPKQAPSIRCFHCQHRIILLKGAL